MEQLKRFLRLFYIINPADTFAKEIKDIPSPNYTTQAVPYFFALIAVEYVIQCLKGKKRTRFNDGITSLSHGIILICNSILMRGTLGYFYIEIYKNWRIFELPWNSSLTWVVTALLVDFGYYWVHRAAHEINFFWAKHQVHHSSEDYNLTTALRQSAFQQFMSWPFYLPMAFFIPPPMYLIHLQFNQMSQFWIHTEVIEDMGILEYILNTPKHHRIHHGSNRYCLDKNYAGVLIIWDKMFGTFASEKEGEKIVYGLVEELKSFNPFWLQIFYYGKVFQKAASFEKIGDKISAFIKGPGWFPGKPRLGDPNDCPVYPDRKIFDVSLPIWSKIYISVQFILSFGGLDHLSKNYNEYGFRTCLGIVCLIIYSLTSIGFLLEGRRVGVYMEVIKHIVLTVLLFFIVFI